MPRGAFAKKLDHTGSRRRARCGQSLAGTGGPTAYRYHSQRQLHGRVDLRHGRGLV